MPITIVPSSFARVVPRRRPLRTHDRDRRASRTRASRPRAVHGRTPRGRASLLRSSSLSRSRWPCLEIDLDRRAGRLARALLDPRTRLHGLRVILLPPLLREIVGPVVGRIACEQRILELARVRVSIVRRLRETAEDDLLQIARHAFGP